MTHATATPDGRTWAAALLYGAVAYGVHRVGMVLDLYRTVFEFQMVTHFLSATGVAVLLVVAGRTLGFRGPRLLAVVAVGSLAGMLGWELVEYLGIFPRLHWWGVGDMLVDLASSGTGAATVLALVWRRGRREGPPGDCSRTPEVTPSRAD